MIQRPVSHTNPQRQASVGTFSPPFRFLSIVRTWRFLGAVWIVVILCVTTMPWSNFKGHSHWKNIYWLPFSDFSLNHVGGYVFSFFANIALFFPLGFCAVRTQRNSTKSSVTRTMLFAAALSTTIELFQSFSHGRIAATTDICTNIAGAVWGASVARRYGGAFQDRDWRGEEKEAA